MNYEIIEAYVELENEIHFSLFHEFLDLYKAGDKETRIAWSVIPANQLIRAWQDYVRLGFVRNERLIDDFQDVIIRNTIKLDLSTIMAGHAVVGVIESKLADFEIADDYPEIDIDKFTEAFSDFFNEQDGSWRISDYGLPKLKEISLELFGERSYEKKLLLIDKALNVVHQRSDLAEWFVEGGSATLTKLQND